MSVVAKLSLLLLALLVLHVADHSVFHAGSAEGATSVVGLLGLASVAAVAGLALAGPRLAPAPAAIVGFGTALGIAVVHLAPSWSAVSDPYPGAGLNAISWTSMSAALVTGFALGLAALAELRRTPLAGP
jgi:hypothetical protein